MLLILKLEVILQEPVDDDGLAMGEKSARLSHHQPDRSSPRASRVRNKLVRKSAHNRVPAKVVDEAGESRRGSCRLVRD